MSEPPAEPAPSSAARRPWWVYAVPYPGRVPDLTAPQWRVLGLLAAAEFFDQYDVGIMGLALSQIQESLAIPEDEIAGVTALVRVGVVVSMALMVLADRIGRRQLLLFTIGGFTLCTFGTAFVRDATEFVALQMLARVFIYAELMLAPVVLAEELHARDRGWGIGMLGALGSIGHGLAALIFAFVDDLPFGWRALYVVGVLPLLLLAWFRRGLPETQRFEEHRRTRRDEGGLRGALRPAVNLVRMYPGRMAVLTLSLFPFDFVIATAFTFMPKTLQEVHGYAPGHVTVLFLVGGLVGILGNIIAGALADRFGRKPIIILGVILNSLAIVGFYNAEGAWIPLLWVGSVFTILAVEVLFKALGAELFPTSYRSTASGMRMLIGSVGGIAGLAIEGTLYTWTGSHAMAITVMAPVLLIPPIAVGLFLPETATRELEDVSPEREVV